jgi:hypothetical protein
MIDCFFILYRISLLEKFNFIYMRFIYNIAAIIKRIR